MATDPRIIIDDNPMSARQWIVVGLMVALNALDGFDVLSSAFAAPGISREWGVPRSALGVVLSAELVGMGFGSLALGGVADRFGRKPAMLFCLVVMAAGMYLASTAGGVTPLTAWRFMTGLGIGGMLAAINAVTAETSSRQGRSVAMALMVIGYPLGAVIGGYVSTEWLLVDFDWRAVFLFGAIVTAGLIPLVLLLVPETPAFLVVVRPARALERINRSLAVLRQPGIEAMPPVADQASKPKITDILSKPQLRKVTLLLAFGYMFHTITFYYILKWSPQIVADFGYAPAQAGTVLTWANIGGATGGALFGFLMMKWDIKWPTIILLLLGSIAVAAFGVARETLEGLARGDLPDRLLHQRRDRRLLFGLRPRLPGPCPRDRHRPRARHRPHRRRRLADPRRLVVRVAGQRSFAGGLGGHGDRIGHRCHAAFHPALA